MTRAMNSYCMTCGAGQREYSECEEPDCEIREYEDMTLDDLVAAVTKEKLKAGKVLIYNPGRHAPLKVSIWWRQIEGSEIGNGVFGVNLVHHNGKGKTLIYNDDYEAARRGFKYACEHAIVLWAAKTMHPKKSEKLH